VVDWSPALGAGDDRPVGHVELIAPIDAGANASWSCIYPEARGWWEEAISAAHCHEVVLTTWLGKDPLARDMVLDLAEHLTQRLKESKSLIRVRFLQREKGRAA